MDVPALSRASEMVAGDALMAKVGLVTVNETVVVSVVLPEVPVTMMSYVPAATVDDTVIVIVEVPVPVIETGLKLMVTPAGWPLADKEMAELNPPVAVLVTIDFPEPPTAMDIDAGDADKLKPGVGGLPASALIKPLPLGLPHPVAKS